MYTYASYTYFFLPSKTPNATTLQPLRSCHDGGSGQASRILAAEKPAAHSQHERRVHLRVRATMFGAPVGGPCAQLRVQVHCVCSRPLQTSRPCVLHSLLDLPQAVLCERRIGQISGVVARDFSDAVATSTTDVGGRVKRFWGLPRIRDVELRLAEQQAAKLADIPLVRQALDDHVLRGCLIAVLVPFLNGGRCLLRQLLHSGQRRVDPRPGIYIYIYINICMYINLKYIIWWCMYPMYIDICIYI